MGCAGIVGALTSGPLRATLLGWFLVGIAIRAILEGDLYLWFISFPVAAALIVGLIVELVRARSISKCLTAVLRSNIETQCFLLSCPPSVSTGIVTRP